MNARRLRVASNVVAVAGVTATFAGMGMVVTPGKTITTGYHRESNGAGTKLGPVVRDTKVVDTPENTVGVGLLSGGILLAFGGVAAGTPMRIRESQESALS